MDFVRLWSEKTELPVQRWLGWLELGRGKFSAWRHRYGKANEHNALVPPDHWLEDWERQAILDFHERFPLEGYRRLTFMMLDQRHRRRQPLLGLSGAVPGRAARALEPASFQKGHRISPATAAP